MTPIIVHLLSILAFIAVVCVSVSGYQISIDTSSLSNNPDYKDSIERIKRQVDASVDVFDRDDFLPTTSEAQLEESSFWDRVINVALKLFSKFIEWLNG